MTGDVIFLTVVAVAYLLLAYCWARKHSRDDDFKVPEGWKETPR